MHYELNLWESRMPSSGRLLADDDDDNDDQISSIRLTPNVKSVRDHEGWKVFETSMMNVN